MALPLVRRRVSRWQTTSVSALFVLVTTSCQVSAGPIHAQLSRVEHGTRMGVDSADDEQRGREAAVAVAGMVLDPSAAAISDARVTLTAQSGVENGHTATNTDGRFSLEKIPPGIYRVDVEASGFRNAMQNITVGTDRTTLIRITMQIASQNEVVTVGAEDLSMRVTTDVAENQNANTIDRDALDRVPVFDQDYITTLSRFLDDSAIGTNGVPLVVNGLEANGPGVTPSAVQEVKINQNPYSALFSRPGRARLEIVTKGGTSDFHGAINFLYRYAVFDASNAFAAKKPAEQRQYYEGSLTGPLGPGKKTTFLLSLDDDLDDQQAVVSAEGLTGPINENVAAPMRHFFGSGRIFCDLANNDQLWIGYSYERQVFKDQGGGGLGLPEAGYNTNSQEHEINFSYRHLFSPSLVNQLRFLVGHFDRKITSINGNPQVLVSGAFTGGGAQADSRRTEYHFDGVDMFIYARGKQTLP